MSEKKEKRKITEEVFVQWCVDILELDNEEVNEHE